VDILYLVDRLENLIAGSRRMPLVNQIIIKESDILNIVDQLRTTIPDEIKQARRIIQDKERILAQAQADANALLARARDESEQAVNREGLLRAAQARSQELLRQAEGEAEQLKNEADNYVIETLRALRDHLNSIETNIGRSILSIEKGLASLQSDVPADDEGASGEEEQSATHSLPRRASLAADTMGGPMYIQEENNWSAEVGEQGMGQRDASPRSLRGYDNRS
jgi:vacuolar-type H+-ATPase subunit H